MEGTMRFLLITILATVVSANYEYDLKYVEKIHEEISTLHRVYISEFNNMDYLAEWEFDKYQTDVSFKITEPAKDSLLFCGGGPSIKINYGPDLCLLQMLFCTTFDNERDSLQLGIVFRMGIDPSRNLIVVLADVLTKPAKEAEQLPGVIYVEPITRQQIASLRNKTIILGSISWVKHILERGIFAGNSSLEDVESGRDTDHTSEVIHYRAYPVVMDAQTVEEILDYIH